MKFLLATAFLVLTSSALAFEVPASAQAKLLLGEAWAEVQGLGEGVGQVRGAVDINAPPALVWRTMLDCAVAGRMITNLASCRIVSGSVASGSDVREHITRRNLVFPGLRIVFRSDYTPYRLIRFQLVEGDLREQHGEWGLIALDGGKRTRVTYENRLAAKGFAPGPLVREALRKDTPKALLALKREAEAAR